MNSCFFPTYRDLYSNSEGASIEKDKEAVSLYILGTQSNTNNYTLNEKVIREAGRKVLGNDPIKINSSVLMPPRGMGHEEFKDRLFASAEKATDNATSYRWCNFKNIGQGKYMLTYLGIPKRHKEGNTVIINTNDIRNLTAEGIQEYKKRRKETEIFESLESKIFDQHGGMY